MIMRHCPVRALRARRLIAATTAPEQGAFSALFERVKEERRRSGAGSRAPSCYVGFDPTADALHVGNLVSLRVLQVLQHHGLRPIALVGGATGLIGDPSGRSTERAMQSEAAIRRNARGIEACVRRLLADGREQTNGAEIQPPEFVNNIDWYLDKTPLDFVRDVGRHFRMGSMLSRESVRSRLDSDQGMSFTEFSYQLFQAYDFLHLHREHDCVLQIGGSDQWGNIVGGCDLVRRVVDPEVQTEGDAAFRFRGEAFGLTVPLLTSSAGEKLGKSAGNAIWADPDKTSPFEFYQYFLGIADADATQCCAMLAMEPDASAEEVGEVMDSLTRSHEESPEKRIPQRYLAEAMTRWVHGEEGLARAQRASEALFGGHAPSKSHDGDTEDQSGSSVAGPSISDLRGVLKDAPTYACKKGDVVGLQLVSVAVNAGAFKSKGEARRMIASGGFYFNQVRVEDGSRVVEESDLVDGGLMVLRVGKKKYTVVECAP